MNTEEMDEQVAVYDLIRTESQAAMRGMINTIGVDDAISVIATTQGETLNDVVGIEGILHAVHQAGQLSGLGMKR